MKLIWTIKNYAILKVLVKEYIDTHDAEYVKVIEETLRNMDGEMYRLKSIYEDDPVARKVLDAVLDN